MKAANLVLLLAALGGSALAGNATFNTGTTFLGPAPNGVVPSHLGMGLSASMSTKERGKRIPAAFTNTVETTTQERYGWAHQAIENHRDYVANWKYIGAKGTATTYTSDRRTLILHAYRLAKIDALDTQRAAAKPPATFTPSEIWYGWLASVVVEGDPETFTAELQAKLLIPGADVEALATQHGLSTRTVFRGLSPKQGATPRWVPSAPEALFKAFDRNPQPTPILVRYLHCRPLATPEVVWTRARPAAAVGELPSGEFTLSIVEFAVAPKNRGKDWDPFGGLPDTVVAVGVFRLRPGSNENVGGTKMYSETVLNTLEPKLKLNTNRFRMTADTYCVLVLEARDEDSGKFEEIGKIKGQYKLHELRSFPAELDLSDACEGSIAKLRIRIDKVE